MFGVGNRSSQGSVNVAQVSAGARGYGRLKDENEDKTIDVGPAPTVLPGIGQSGRDTELLRYSTLEGDSNEVGSVSGMSIDHMLVDAGMFIVGGMVLSGSIKIVTSPPLENEGFELSRMVGFIGSVFTLSSTLIINVLSCIKARRGQENPSESMNIVKQMRNLRNVGAVVSMTALGGAALYEKNVHPAC